ncbi:MAG: SoxR reducing system RseC family protein [Planctomycetota bacterium]
MYEQLGKTEGPSVVWKVIAAFLLPILVFIAGLIFFDWLLAKKIESSWLRTLLDFFFSLIVTFIGILIIKLTCKFKRE